MFFIHFNLFFYLNFLNTKLSKSFSDLTPKAAPAAAADAAPAPELLASIAPRSLTLSGSLKKPVSILAAIFAAAASWNSRSALPPFLLTTTPLTVPYLLKIFSRDSLKNK